MLLEGGRSRWRWVWVAPLVFILAGLSFWMLPQLSRELTLDKPVPGPQAPPLSDASPPPGGGSPAPGRGGPPLPPAPEPPAPEPPAGPDLIIFKLTETGMTIKNVGDESAGPFLVGVYFMDDPLPFMQSDGLAPEGELDVPWGTCFEGEIEASVDVENSVAESNENNNYASIDYPGACVD